MTPPKANSMELSVICIVFAAIALIGIVWDITSGLLTSGIDGIMLLSVCLMMAGIFGLMLLMTLHQAGLIPFFRGASAPSPAPAVAKAAAAPAPVTQPTQATHAPVAAAQPAPAARPPAPPTEAK